MKQMKHVQKVTLVLVLAIMFLSIAMPVGFARSNVELPYFLNQFDGTQLDLTQYWGKAYILFFFRENSPACMQQMPAMKQIFDEYSSDDLQIIMIHEWANETHVNTQNVIAQYGLEGMTFYEDMDMSIAKKINIPDCPMTIFMNKGGYLTDAFVYTVSYAMMAEVIDSMGVPKAPPKPVETIAPTPIAPIEPMAPIETLAPAAEETAAPTPVVTEAPVAALPTPVPAPTTADDGILFGAIGPAN